jgi:ribonuclease T1
VISAGFCKIAKSYSVSRLVARISRFFMPGPRAAWTLALCSVLLLAQSFEVAGMRAAWARERPARIAPTIPAEQLPAQARQTLRLIRQGGPFPYAKDGIVFGNYEHILPQRRRGYYREYTVPTPGSRNRGAQRIVCGGPKRAPDLCYYTHDHYASFQSIAQ